MAEFTQSWLQPQGGNIGPSPTLALKNAGRNNELNRTQGFNPTGSRPARHPQAGRDKHADKQKIKPIQEERDEENETVGSCCKLKMRGMQKI